MNPSLIGTIAGSRRRTVAASGITQDAVTTNESGSSSPSFSHSQGALTNGYAVVIFNYYWYSPITLSSPTYDGVAMTLLGSVQVTDNFHTVIYGVALGTSGAGSKTVAATLTTHYGCFTTVLTFSGVHQTNSFTTGGGSGWLSTGPAVLNLTTTSSDEVCVASINFTTGTTITTSQTNVSGNGAVDVSKADGTGGTVSFSWSWPSGTKSASRSGVVLQPSP